ncbi:MAG: MATE family efflux transporter [Catonella sp.]|nr:MATE family efflux transporter [Catonella sp.]MDY6356076.1 MATE family efflux transporter [Catonella sp.]
MIDSKEDMTTGSVNSKIIMFAVPVFIGNLFQQLYNTVDSLIVGRFLNTDALAAVSSYGNLVFLCIGFFNGVSLGASVVIARYIGAKDKKNIENSVHTTVAVGLLFSVIMTVVGVNMMPAVLKWMQTPDSVVPYALSYYRIYFAGSIGFVMYNTFVGILQAAGDSRHPLYYLVFSSIVNIALDLLFIVVFHQGVGSAALATVIAQILSAILAMIRLMRVKEDYRLKLTKIGFRGNVVGQILIMGLPSGLQNSIIAISNVVIQSYINMFGDAAMAGIGSYLKIEGFAFLPVTSFSLALTTFVGQNEGAKQRERTKQGIKFGVISCIVIAEIIGLLILAFANPLMAAFDPHPDVIKYGVWRAWVCTPFYFLVSFSHVMAAVLRGLGHPLAPMLIMLICWCAVRIAFLAIMSQIYPSIWLTYIIYPITWTLSTTAMLIYYKKLRI